MYGSIVNGIGILNNIPKQSCVLLCVMSWNLMRSEMIFAYYWQNDIVELYINEPSVSSCVCVWVSWRSCNVNVHNSIKLNAPNLNKHVICANSWNE